MNVQIDRMSPLLGLSAINFFLADVQDGLGPFLATWLAETAHWDPARIGVVMTIAGIAGLVFNAPAGNLVDRLDTPRLLLALSALAVVAGTLGLLASDAFIPVLVSQIVTAIGGAFMAPGLVALTLGLVGKNAFPDRQGKNQAWNHAGNVAAGVAVAGATFVTGPASAFWVMAGMAAGSMAALLLIPSSAIHAESREKGSEQASLRAILTDRRLVFLAVALLAFHLGNAAMLPMLGQRMAAIGAGNPTRWLAACVIVAQLTMIPVALLAGRMADRVNRAWLLVAACMVLPVRGVLAALATDPWLLIPVQVLDGCGAGTLGVVIPLLVADYTWGSGRTQTALGAVATAQGVGASLSATVGGVLATEFGWEAAFLGLAVPAALSLVLAFRLAGQTASLNAASIKARV